MSTNNNYFQNIKSMHDLYNEIYCLEITCLSCPDDQYTKIVHGSINNLNQKIRGSYEDKLTGLNCTLSILKEIERDRASIIERTKTNNSVIPVANPQFPSAQKV